MSLLGWAGMYADLSPRCGGRVTPSAGRCDLSRGAVKGRVSRADDRATRGTERLLRDKEDLVKLTVRKKLLEGSARRTTMLLISLAVLVAGGLGLVITRGITRSVAVMRRAAAGIAEGDLDQDVSVRSRDELGDMAAAFERMIAYVRDAAGAAERVAANDLTVGVTPRSERDVLGQALAAMAANLRTAIGQVAD